MGREKLVDTWYYDVQDLEDIEISRPLVLDDNDDDDAEAAVKRNVITKKVEIKLYLDKVTGDSDAPPYELKKVQFIVRCDEPNFDYRGTDIETLRATAWSHLGKCFEVKWEEFFLVKVDPEPVYDGLGSGMRFTYKWVYKGTTWDGKELLKENEPFQRRDKIRPWPGRFSDKNDKTIACIPATKANHAALNEFARRIDTLRKMISDTLRPETIMSTLQNLSTLNLLPPANE